MAKNEKTPQQERAVRVKSLLAAANKAESERHGRVAKYSAAEVAKVRDVTRQPATAVKTMSFGGRRPNPYRPMTAAAGLPGKFGR